MVLSTTKTRHHIAKAKSPILRAADKAEPAIRRAMLDALEALQRSVPNLEDLIASGNIKSVVDAVKGADIPRSLMNALTDATATAAIGGAEAAGFEIGFNLPNARAVEWAAAHAGEQITAVSQATKMVVQEVVEDAIRRGIHPRIAARRIKDVVPLLPNHQKLVNRMWFGMLESGVTESHADKIVGRKATKLLKYRTEMIARTEAIRAANMGQQLVWQQAIDLDLLPQGVKKIWLATGDDRTCPICAVMDGQTVEVSGGEFNVNRQATGFVRSGSSFRVSGTKPYRGWGKQASPPAHPQCRCTMILETIDTPRRAQPQTQQKPITTSSSEPVLFDNMKRSANGLPRSMAPIADEALDLAESAVNAHPDAAVLRARIAKMDEYDKVNPSFQRRHRSDAGKSGEYAPRIDVGDPTTMRVFMEVGSHIESAESTASTIIHEITHAVDDQLGAGRELVRNRIVTEGSNAAREAQREAKRISETIGHPYRDTFRYAASDPAEALADIVTMEIYGIPERVYSGGQLAIREMTPDVFRREFPDMSRLARRWINGEFDA